MTARDAMNFVGCGRRRRARSVDAGLIEGSDPPSGGGHGYHRVAVRRAGLPSCPRRSVGEAALRDAIGSGVKRNPKFPRGLLCSC